MVNFWRIWPTGSGKAPRITLRIWSGCAGICALPASQVLTKRQQQMLELYYDQGLTMGQIAAKLHLNRSTVCRTLQRARERLYACLRYTL